MPENEKPTKAPESEKPVRRLLGGRLAQIQTKKAPEPEAPVEVVTETTPAPEAVVVEPEPEAPVEVVVEPQGRRCQRCGRKWSSPAPDACPECGGATKEE